MDWGLPSTSQAERFFYNKSVAIHHDIPKSKLMMWQLSADRNIGIFV